ncbi:uncharacterized protein LOC143284067 [Babylonia areolata]|uniref:uncharacterized protein LOC143284067 n=1 Tax=Babylonia areolata TaxID=304850 RepID=UPI003FD35C5C
MWRFWNCVPRFVRQQLHGPRASAGVCVEEEKGDHEAREKFILTGCADAKEKHGTAQEQGGFTVKDSEAFEFRKKHFWGPHGCRFRSHPKADVQEADPKGERCQEQRKGDCHGQFRPSFHGQNQKKEHYHGQCRPPFHGKDQKKEHFYGPFWRPFHFGNQKKEDCHGPFWSPSHFENQKKEDSHTQFRPLFHGQRPRKEDGCGQFSHPQETDLKGEGHHEQTRQRKEASHSQFWSRVRSQNQRKEDGERRFWTPFYDQQDASEYEHHHRWKEHWHGHFWSQLWGPHRSLEAVTWGAAMVFGLHMSRKPQLQDFFETWKDPDKRQHWWNVLLRVAFSMPPGESVSVSRSITQGPLPQKQDAETKSVDSPRKAQEKVPETVVPEPEDKKTLSDVMQEFEASCQNYTAVANSVSGVLAVEQGKFMTAVEHLQMASRLGHAPAYFNLAVCYETGLGMKKDLEQAAVYYQMGADVGHTQSIFNLALMTLRGEGGIAKDRAKAIQLLTKAAHKGLAQAQTYLGMYYTEDDDNQQDFEQAASFFNAAASQNDAEAQYFLGVCYENGWGVESSDEEAAKLYSAAAELGHDGALYNLAAFHEYGLGGIARDEEEAMVLYRRSAESGNENAKFRLQEEEAKKAVSLWSEQNSSTISEPSPGLRKNSRSSSPVLTDYMRESIAGIWSGELTAWFSSQSLNSSSKLSDSQRPVFLVGDYDPVSPFDVSDTEMNTSLLDFPQRVSVHQSCFAGLHRTSTMPELRAVSCQ